METKRNKTLTVLPEEKYYNEHLREYTDTSISWTITKTALYSMAREDNL